MKKIELYSNFEIIKNDDEFIGDKLKTRKKRRIDVDRFLNLFGNQELNYDSLTSSENCTEKNGWKEIFAEWKEKGIIE